MKWKCVNDWFGYCSEEPDGAGNARMEERSTKVNGVDTIVKINLGMGATCSLSPKTCGKRQSFNQVCPEGTAPEETVTKTTIIADKKVKKNKGKQLEIIEEQ